MRRADRPLREQPHGTRVGLLVVLILAALPLLVASAFRAPAAQTLQQVSYLPLIMSPPYYRIVFEQGGSIYVANADGSNPTQLAGGSKPDWSPDGHKIAFERSGSIYVMNADGSDQTYLAGGTEPHWSPDGRRIAFDGGDIGVMDADGSHVIAITKSKYHQNMSPAWSPDGSRIAFVYGDELYSYGYDICVKKSNGFTTMWDLSKALSDADDFSPAWSPDGRWVAFSSSYPFYEHSIYIVHPDGTGLTRLTAGDGTPAWSPDGRRIAFAASGDIFAINVDGSGRTNLTEDPADDTKPVWAPDGRRIAFERGGGIYVMNADGSDQITLAYGTDPHWSPTIN